MKIGLDYDGTLADNRAVEIAARNLGLINYPDYSYGLAELSKEHRAETWRLFTDPEYMGNLQALPGAIDQLYQWKNLGHELIVITARGPKLQPSTRIAIEDDFPVVSKILFVDVFDADKTVLMKQEGIDMWIDDSAHNAVAAKNSGIETYLISNKRTVHNHQSRSLFPADHIVERVAQILFKTIRIKCDHCHALLKPTIHDLQDNRCRTFVKCPHCRRPVNVLTNKIPPSWKHAIYKGATNEHCYY